MSEDYTTEDLVNYLLPAEGLGIRLLLPPEVSNAIVARLRAADKLCEAAKEARESQGWDGNNPDDDRWKELYASLRKAIAEYEGGK